MLFLSHCCSCGVVADEVVVKPRILKFLTSRLGRVISALGLAALLGVALYKVLGPDDDDGFQAKAVRRGTHKAPPRTPESSTVPSIERDTSTFSDQTRAIANSDECFPVHIRDIGRIGMLYLYCSEDAYNHDG